MPHGFPSAQAICSSMQPLTHSSVSVSAVIPVNMTGIRYSNIVPDHEQSVLPSFVFVNTRDRAFHDFCGILSNAQATMYVSLASDAKRSYLLCVMAHLVTSIPI